MKGMTEGTRKMGLQKSSKNLAIVVKRLRNSTLLFVNLKSLIQQLNFTLRFHGADSFLYNIGLAE